MTAKNYCSEVENVLAFVIEAERSVSVIGRGVEVLAHAKVLRTVLELAVICSEAISLAVVVLGRRPFVERTVFVPVAAGFYAERLLNVFVTEHTQTSTMNNIKPVDNSTAGGGC